MNGIEVRVYNTDLELQGIIDEFSSLIWIRRYQEPGEFELQTPYTDESRRLLVPNNIVQRFDGLAVVDAGVIENIRMTSDTIIVKGRFLEGLFDLRITKNGTQYFSGKVEESLRSLVDNTRHIWHLYLGEKNNLDETLEFQTTFKSLLNIVSKACKATALGFRIRPDFEDLKMYFEIYKGEDRTYNNADKVIFSDTYDNIFNEEYQYDNTNYKTNIWATQIVNDYREVVNVMDPDALPLNIREGHISTSVDTNNKTTEEIHASMEVQAWRAMDSRTINESFTFAVDAEAPFRYRTDYDLGDKVNVKHMAWGIDLSLRITAIEEDFVNGGREVVLTCGSPMPEIIDFEEG